MQQKSDQTTATERVVARLYAEGWVDCPNIGSPALSEQSIVDMRAFILNQLQQASEWMGKDELALTTLIFSVLDHEFRVHPQFEGVLEQLESDGRIECKRLGGAMNARQKPKFAVALSQYSVAQLR